MKKFYRMKFDNGRITGKPNMMFVIYLAITSIISFVMLVLEKKTLSYKASSL